MPVLRWRSGSADFAASRATGYAAPGVFPVFAALSMRCHVYKSRVRPDTYVYLAEEDGFDVLPPFLRQRLGALDAALQFDLTAQRRLARADAARVIRALETQGFYLQLPPGQVETE